MMLTSKDVVVVDTKQRSEVGPDAREEREGDPPTVGCFSKTLFLKKIRAIPSRTPLGSI